MFSDVHKFIYVYKLILFTNMFVYTVQYIYTIQYFYELGTVGFRVRTCSCTTVRDYTSISMFTHKC